MRAVATDELPLSKDFADEMSYCLGCLACQTACPAGVDYATLFETARADVEEAGMNGSTSRKLLRFLTLDLLFTRPRVLRLAGRALRLYQKFGSPLPPFLPSRWKKLAGQAPKISKSFSHELIEPIESSEAPLRKVAVLTGCVQDLAYAEMNRDTVDVLLANSCEIHTPPVQPCCGSIHSHNGETEMARENARRLLDLLPPDDYDAIISNAGGCGSH